MREKKSAMDAASEELERRSRYLSSLIPRTKLKTEEEEKDKEKGKEKDKEELDPQDQQNVRVRAADMSPAMQRKAFRCAREVLKEMTKLDSKRLALALKKEGSAKDLGSTCAQMQASIGRLVDREKELKASVDYSVSEQTKSRPYSLSSSLPLDVGSDEDGRRRLDLFLAPTNHEDFSGI